MTTKYQLVYSLDAGIPSRFANATDRARVGGMVRVKVQTLAGGRVMRQLGIMATLADGAAGKTPTDATNGADASGISPGVDDSGRCSSYEPDLWLVSFSSMSMKASIRW